MLFQLTPPRKGTETSCAASYETSECYFNLSPQGDGNPLVRRIFFQPASISTYPRKGTETSMLVLIITVVHAFQLIPVRGRKHRGGQERALTILFQLIPARGRKHKEDDSGFYFAELFQLIPARGRKPNTNTSLHFHDIISTYPRKGTKTMLFIIVSTPLLLQLIPARGQKTPHQKWCGVFLLRALTFRFSWAFSL